MATAIRSTLAVQCAYCGAILPTISGGVEAWRIGDRFVCNEFCADGIPDETARATAAIENGASSAPVP